MIAFCIFLALALSALFSGTEIAFVSANKVKVELLRKKGTRRSNILSEFYGRPTKFLGTLLVGNNIMLVIFSILMTKVLSPVLGPIISNEPVLLLANTIVITVVVLIFGEFLPKTMFRLYADRLMYFFALPLRLISWLLYVPVWFTLWVSNGVLRVLFKRPLEHMEEVFTRDELENFVRDSVSNMPEDIDADLFENALQFKHVRVRDCMIPRTEITDIDVSSDIQTLKDLIIETNHSRIIVTEGDIDHVLGYVHHQQLHKNPRNIRQMLIKIPLVPETMQVERLMNRFIRDQINIAWVVDEYGGTSGIITLEDILEEIFGEIEDEHDKEEYVEQIISEHEFLFSGRLEIDYLNNKYEVLDFPEGEYNTLSGYLVTAGGTIPDRGKAIVVAGYRFVVEIVSDKKIELIRVIKVDDKDEKAPL